MNYRSFAGDDRDDNTDSFYSLATAMVKQARKDARGGDCEAMGFLSDWRDYFATRSPDRPRIFRNYR